MSEDKVEVDVEVLCEQGRAWRVLTDKARTVFLPQSETEIEGNRVLVPVWLAEREGLV